ncbi:MAG: hypothetical protein H7096_09865 [Flavobacterium sp.]|nr:hypothetical protein [Pedobacter sp.]
MKSQYSQFPVTYQNSEPLNYLETFAGLRQISVEMAKRLQAEYQKCKESKAQFSAGLDKDGENNLTTLFNSHTFNAL